MIMDELSKKYCNLHSLIDEISKYQEYTGFVPQEDVMLRMLSVREILDHSAR
jgi:ABC-type multidrug transport system ATPase subunit